LTLQLSTENKRREINYTVNLCRIFLRVANTHYLTHSHKDVFTETLYMHHRLGLSISSTVVTSSVKMSAASADIALANSSSCSQAGLSGFFKRHRSLSKSVLLSLYLPLLLRGLTFVYSLLVIRHIDLHLYLNIEFQARSYFGATPLI